MERQITDEELRRYAEEAFGRLVQPLRALMGEVADSEHKQSHRRQTDETEATWKPLTRKKSSAYYKQKQMENKMALYPDQNCDYPEEGAYPYDRLLMEPQVEKLVYLAREEGRKSARADYLQDENYRLNTQLKETQDKLRGIEYRRDILVERVNDLEAENAKLLNKIPKKPIKKTVKKGKK